MLCVTSQWEDKIQAEETKLEVVLSEIKCEFDEEVTVDLAVNDTRKVLSKDTFQLESISVLTPKCEPKCEEVAGHSAASSSPGQVVGMGKKWGKCPVCPRSFVRDRFGFEEISRHIFNCHKKNYLRNLFILRMVNYSPHSYAVHKRGLKDSHHIQKGTAESDRVLRSHKSKLTHLTGNLDSSVPGNTITAVELLLKLKVREKLRNLEINAVKGNVKY